MLSAQFDHVREMVAPFRGLLSLQTGLRHQAFVSKYVEGQAKFGDRDMVLTRADNVGWKVPNRPQAGYINTWSTCVHWIVPENIVKDKSNHYSDGVGPAALSCEYRH